MTLRSLESEDKPVAPLVAKVERLHRLARKRGRIAEKDSLPGWWERERHDVREGWGDRRDLD